MIRIALLSLVVVALAGCKKSPAKKEAEPAPPPAAAPERAPVPAATPVPAAEEAAAIESARALATRAVFAEPVKKPFVPMQDKLVDYVAKVAGNPSPEVTVGACRSAPDARCVLIDAPCTGGCDVNGMTVWLRIDGDKLTLDHALLGDIPIKSEADIDAVYREIDGE